MNKLFNINNEQNPPRFWTQAVFWLVFFAFGFYIKPLTWDLMNSLIWASGNTLFFIISVNINIYFLLPKFMLKHTLLSYLALLIGLTLILTPFVTLFNIWMMQRVSQPGPAWMSIPHFHFINILIITALSSLIRIPLDWLKMQTEKNELLTRNMETELQSLKNQINPHFLFNTLNNLYALTLKKSEQAPEVVLKLSDMMRYMLYECNEKEVLMEKEFRYIHNYIELEKLRHSSDADIRFSVDDELMIKRIAPLLLIPFVENSFKHGSQTSIEKSFIHIEAKLENDFLEFQVINSKPELIPGQFLARKPGGVGLTNVYKRLQLIYPLSHTLKIEDMPDTYSVYLTIKLNSVNHDKDLNY